MMSYFHRKARYVHLTMHKSQAVLVRLSLRYICEAHLRNYGI